MRRPLMPALLPSIHPSAATLAFVEATRAVPQDALVPRASEPQVPCQARHHLPGSTTIRRRTPMLHTRSAVREGLLDEVAASSDLSVSMPKYRLPEREQDPRHVFQVVMDELMLDGNSRQNLATF